jgi:hypothetical protein
MPRANRRRFFLSGVAALPRSRDGTVSSRAVSARALFSLPSKRNEKKNGFGFGRAIFGFND